MAEKIKGSLYEHFRRAWPVLFAIGAGLLWLGRNVETKQETDSRVRAIILPLQNRAEWIEAELRRGEGTDSATAERMNSLDWRIKQLEDRLQ